MVHLLSDLEVGEMESAAAGRPRAEKDLMPMMSSPQTLLVLADRGTMPFEALHGEPLYLHALRALVDAFPAEATVSVDVHHEARVRAEVNAFGLPARVVAGHAWWAESDRQGTDLILHDALCPLTSVQFLREVRERAVERPGCSFMSFRPVTDTLKTIANERIRDTIDREGLAALTSPALVSASALGRATRANRRPPLSDFAELAAWLRTLGDVELVKAPSLARRVDDPSAVNVLECLDEVGRRVRIESSDPQVVHSPLSGGSGTRTP